MKKKIYICILVSFLMIVSITCTPIQAKTNTYTSTGIQALDAKGNQIKDTIGDGCFISIVDFLDTIQNFISFVNLHENKEHIITGIDLFDVSEFLSCCIELNGKYTYIENNTYGSYFLYFPSKSKLNNWLINNRYIDPMQTFEDPVYGFTGPEINKVERNPYLCLHEILSTSELEFYIINPNHLPKEFYKEQEKTIGNRWYTIYNQYDYAIIDGKWNYQVPGITEEEGEVSKIDIPDSVGKFEKDSQDTYKYTYTKLSWNKEFGYYSHNQAEVETRIIQESDMPSIAFDSNHYLKDEYYSVNANVWYKAYVKDVTKEMDFNCYCNRVVLVDEYHRASIDELVGSGIGSYCYFEMYFNFSLPIDCIYQLCYDMPLYYKLPFKTYHVNDFRCTLTFDQKASISQIVDYDNWFEFFLHPFTVTEFVSIPVIEAGNYSFDVDGERKNYSWKTIFVDDNYSVYNANVSYLLNGEKIITWENTSEKFINGPTYFNSRYFSSQDEEPIIASGIYSYKGVLYSFEDVKGNLDNSGKIDEDWIDKLLQLLKEIWNYIISWLNSSTFAKICKWILIILLIMVAVYLVVKLVKRIKNKKSTK